MNSVSTALNDVFDFSEDAVQGCWGNINWDHLLSDDYINELYEKATATAVTLGVLNSKEDQEQYWSGHCFIPNFEEDPPSLEMRNKYLNCLIVKQCVDFREFNRKAPAATITEKRVLIIKVISQTLYNNYHKSKRQTCAVRGKSCISSNGSSELSQEKTEINESDILMEMSVKTLTTFLFSLMRMSWSSPDPRMGILCDEVLNSCSSMLLSIPTLALANTARMPQAATKCLDEVMEFLSGILRTESIGENSSKSMSCGILLGLSMLRGNVVYLLSWIKSCLVVSVEGKDVGIKCDNFQHWLKSLQGDQVENLCYIFLKLVCSLLFEYISNLLFK